MDPSASHDHPLKLAFFVVRWFPFGGMQRALLRIAHACRQWGGDVEIFCGQWEGERPEGIRVTELARRGWSNHARNALLGRAFVEATRQGYGCRVGFNKVPGLDVYYAADPCFAARAADRSPIYRWTPRYRRYRALEAGVFARGQDTTILLHAHGEKARFIAHYDTEPERFILLPPGLDRQRLDRAAAAASQEGLRVRLGLGSGDCLLLAVGSHFRTKGVDRTVRALEKLPASIHLAVVGAGDERWLTRLARRAGVAGRLHLLGAVDAAACLRQADLLVHPARTENTGGVLLEAIYSGLPVLTTANCGYAFHIQQADAGVVLPEPFEQRRFEATLQRVVSSHRWKEWTANGESYCNQHDLYGLVEQAAAHIRWRAWRKQGILSGVDDGRPTQ